MTCSLRAIAFLGLIATAVLSSAEPRLSRDPAYFPIAVWLQSPANAEAYRKAGINLYVGLWRGPDAAQLRQLSKAGMQVICSQNEEALRPEWTNTVVAWMHGDEPDNAQSLGQGKGYGPPITPEVIIQNYQRLKEKDPTRPILLNLGQGVAWDDYIGRGTRRRHPEDYAEYVKGCDIASFDIYPVVHDSQSVSGKLEFVGLGVERLRKWTPPTKAVWNCLECTHISNPNRKATPAQVKTEAWMGLIHGSTGLIYFVHQFKPSFREAALLDDAEMLAGVTALNTQIQSLAPVLNSETIASSSGADESVHWMLKSGKTGVFLFAAQMKDEPSEKTFDLSKSGGVEKVEVLNESRTVAAHGGRFSDAFAPYAVHIYKVIR